MVTEIRVPTLGESIVEATISKWLKHEGETVSAGEPLLELETDKVNIEVSAEHDGVLGPLLKHEGDRVGIGDLLGTIVARNGQTRATPPAFVAPERTPAPRAAATVSAPTAPPFNVTPLAQRFAEENAVDLQQVRGSGPGGRVTKEDVIHHLQPAADPPPAPKPAPTPPTATPPPPSIPIPSSPLATTPQPREERVRMSRRRQTIAQRLVEAQHTAAILTTFNEIDMSRVIEIRRRWKERFQERHEVNLGFMSFFTRAVIGALRAFPMVNAEIQGDEIVIKHYYDIGIAVGTEQGLVVPVLREADRKTFAQIERDIFDLAQRARSNTLSLADLQGGTFSITNGGVYGSLMSTPILNAPQVGILGLHKVEERPVVVKGEIVVRPMMYVALSYDHRIIDGNVAVRFLVRIKELIEDPEVLLLEG